jgi:hypothetical protein
MYATECYETNIQPYVTAQPKSYAEMTKLNCPQTENKKGITKNFTQRPPNPENYTNVGYAKIIQLLEMFQPRNSIETTTPNLIQSEDTTNALTKFLDEFKNLIQQLLQQNTMVLNMLTTLVNKMK